MVSDVSSAMCVNGAHPIVVNCCFMGHQNGHRLRYGGGDTSTDMKEKGTAEIPVPRNCAGQQREREGAHQNFPLGKVSRSAAPSLLSPSLSFDSPFSFPSRLLSLASLARLAR